MWWFLGCAAHVSPLPLGAHPEPELLLAWVGTGRAHLWVDGAWVRTPASDYEFSVVQRRYSDRWSSVKQVHRFDPAYDGSAGPRDPLWHFGLGLTERGDGWVVSLDTSLGAGSGTTDRGFRDAVLDIEADVPGMAPFDHYRITQHYDYEGGRLVEEVLLYEGGVDHPFARMDEEAVLLAPGGLTVADLASAPE